MSRIVSLRVVLLRIVRIIIQVTLVQIVYQDVVTVRRHVLLVQNHVSLSSTSRTGTGTGTGTVRMVVTAYPTGAGGCLGNVPAVNESPHVNPLLHTKVRGGTLTDAGIVVKILGSSSSSGGESVDVTLLSNRVLDATTTTSTSTSVAPNVDFSIDTNYTISVIGTQYAYKGCLIRLQGIENQSSTVIKESLVPDTNTKEIGSTICTDPYVTGLTHTDNEFKQQHKGILRLDEIGRIQLDVTIVGVNNESISLYAYDNFTINFVQPPPIAVPVPAPVVPTTTSTTTAAPVSVPTSSTTAAPVTNSTTTAVDDQFLESISETIADIAITYDNVTTLSLVELIDLQAITNKWFLDFYNNRSSQTPNTTNPLTTNTTTTTASSLISGRRWKLRSLQTTTTDKPPPQAFVVQGSMISTINNVRQETQGSSNVVTYNQELKYQIYKPDSPTLPSSMKGPENYYPLQPSEYAILPYKSTSANTDLALLLQQRLPGSFGGMVTPIALPVIPTTPTIPTPTTKRDSGGSGGGVNVGMIVGIVVGVAAVLIIGYIGYSMNDNSNKRSTSVGSEDNKSNSNSASTRGSHDNNGDAAGGRGNAPGRNSGNSKTYNNNESNKMTASNAVDISMSDYGSQFTSAVISISNNDNQNTTIRQPLKAAPVVPQSNDPNPALLFAKKQPPKPAPSSSNNNNNTYETSKTTTEVPLSGGSSAGGATKTPPNRNSSMSTRKASNAYGASNNYNDKDDEYDTSDNANAQNSVVSGGGTWSVGAATNIGSVATGSIILPTSNGTNHHLRDEQEGHRNKNNGTNTMGGAGNGASGPAMSGNPNEYVVYAPSGKLGIVVDNPDDDSGPIIYAIKETSPLLDSKLNVGDRLIMVDEVNVTKMAPALISKLISRRANNPMRKLTLLKSIDPQEERMVM